MRGVVFQGFSAEKGERLKRLQHLNVLSAEVS